MANVTIQSKAFAFCRYSLAVLVWLSLGALVLDQRALSMWLIGSVFVIMALSAVFTVRYAPLVWLWTNTIGRVVPSTDAVVDVDGMRFSHTLAAALSLVSLSMIWRDSPWAFGFLGALAVLKTINAVYACPAYKLWGALVTGGG